MPETRNLCAKISLELHQKVCEARESSGLTTAQYITELLTEYFKMKENGGNITMTNNNTRTLAFQIDESLFLRIKAHLEREAQRTGKKLTQREFVLGLIEEALEAAEQQAGEDRGKAGVGPSEAESEDGSPQPQEEGKPTMSGAGQAV